MPESARHNRSLNLTDEIWIRLHQAYLAVGQASPEALRKSDFVERVLQAGISAELALAQVSLPSRPTRARRAEAVPAPKLGDVPVPAEHRATPEPSTSGRPAATAPRQAPVPPSAGDRPRQTAAERRREAAARLAAIAAPPRRPPAIQSAAKVQPVSEEDEGS
jgi:hypothetical protein